MKRSHWILTRIGIVIYLSFIFFFNVKVLSDPYYMVQALASVIIISSLSLLTFIILLKYVFMSWKEYYDMKMKTYQKQIKEFEGEINTVLFKIERLKKIYSEGNS